MKPAVSGFPLLAVLWLGAVATALTVRPLTPVDETRYLAVAWEMWNRGDFLVPHLNGAPYSHKPPLLFWLMHLGWTVTGVNEWWPRLVSPLVSLANLALVGLLARRLWPRAAGVSALAPWIAFGAMLWLAFSTLTMFDMLIVCFALLGMLALVEAWRGSLTRGFALLGLAIGCGVLSKGPVILLHLLPAALLAPWWAREPRPRWGAWYLGVVAAILLGAAIALAWAIPAGRAGGPAYHNAIFWGQTAERMASSFAHRQPWWWYLPLLPAILFPWPWWPPLWRAFRRLGSELKDGAVRFVLAWIAPVFLGFTLISGKQPQYLLPLFAGLALLAARLLTIERPEPRRTDSLLVAGILFGFGVLLAFLPALPIARRLPMWAGAIGIVPGVLIAAMGVALLLWRPRDAAMATRNLTAVSLGLLVVLHAGVLIYAAPTLDVAPIARRLGDLESTGESLAHLGKYHGQYTFVGRLHAPLTVVRSAKELTVWAKAHPGGRVVAYDDQIQADATARPEFEQPYRSGRVQLWDPAVLAPLLASAQDGPRTRPDED